MVKDLRTGVETGNVQAVMDGELDAFVHAFGCELVDRPVERLRRIESFLMTDSADSAGLSYDEALEAFSDQSLLRIRPGATRLSLIRLRPVRWRTFGRSVKLAMISIAH